MATIKIIGVTGTAPHYQLILDDGGHKVVYGKKNIRWKVDTDKVRRIEGIVWKDVPGSTNIFAPGYPAAENDEGTVWSGRNEYNVDCAYIYGIKWVHVDDEDDDEIREFDPIISIRPLLHSTRSSLRAGLLGVVGIVALGAAILLTRKRSK